MWPLVDTKHKRVKISEKFQENLGVFRTLPNIHDVLELFAELGNGLYLHSYVLF